MTCHRAWLASLGLAFLAAGGPFAATPPTDAGEEGRALAAELQDQRPTKNSQFDGALKIREASGKVTQVPVRLEVAIGGSEWRSVYEAFAADRSVTEKLAVVHADHEPNRYLLARPTGPAGPLSEPTVLTGAQAARAFAGSDFSLTDLGLEFFHWPEQRLIKHEMRKGRACKVLESVNPSPAAGAYARVWSWVDAETGGLVRAEAYDGHRQLLKEFAVNSLKKVNGRWELKRMEIRNEQTGSRTQLELNVTID
jgi:hypothetical protein